MDFSQQQGDVIAAMQHTLAALQASDPATLALLAKDNTTALNGDANARRNQAIDDLTISIAAAQAESVPDGHPYHSRDSLTGLIQSQIEDNVLPQLQAYSEGNPVVWIPAGILGVLEHFNPKYPFQTATAASRIQIPDNCKIALLGDWGANNDHALAIGQLAIGHGADYIIHLGDIYYSGTEPECQQFLTNWPLKSPDGTPMKGKSFALNGNHEMYSLGRPYFTTVLPAFGQEASYFTLYNSNWQFQGLDTAYVPFSIGGSGLYGAETDARLQAQWDWLVASITGNPGLANIFLSHQQPVSAHMEEFIQAGPLIAEIRALLQPTGENAIYGWFFGHEHRCTIYQDIVTDPLSPATYFRARLIGNGAIRHHPQEELLAEAVSTGPTTNPFLMVNKGTVDPPANLVAISTFAMLTLNGPNIHVDYINEDNTVFYSEDWDATQKLSQLQRAAGA